MKVFSGLYTGLVSPFCDGEFDEESSLRPYWVRKGVRMVLL
jgi:hypothetical protein